MSVRLSVDDARDQIMARITPTTAHERIAASEAFGRIIVEDIAATVDLPAFDYSAVDGYAVRALDVQDASIATPARLRVLGRIAPGAVVVTDHPNPISHADRAVAQSQTDTKSSVWPVNAVGRRSQSHLGPRQAWRVLTGAPIPLGVDAVVPFESTRRIGVNPDLLDRRTPPGFGGWSDDGDQPDDEIHVVGLITQGDNIRRRGEDQRSGEIVLRSGTRLRPAEVAVLASMGRVQIWVYRCIRVGVLATGDELQPRDAVGELPLGMVRDANGPGLLAMLARDGYISVDLGQAPDHPDAIRQAFGRAVALGCDAVITSGGVSMGDRDMVRQIVGLDGRVHLWSIDLRPGKPFAFGEVHGRPIFGVPGNPVSALVTYDLLIGPGLRCLSGSRPGNAVELMAKTESRIVNDSGRENFLRGVARTEVDDGGNVGWSVRLTGPQGSGILTSLSRANCYVRIPARVTEVAAGELVRVRLSDPPTLW